MKENANKKSTLAAIIAVQFACVLILIAGVFAVKYISPAKYKKISQFFSSKMCEDTSVEEFLKLFKNAD